MKGYISKSVICPFYKQDEGLKIRCEGFCASCSLQISFGNKETLLLHRKIHCESFDGYLKCPLFPVINRQYEGAKSNQ